MQLYSFLVKFEFEIPWLKIYYLRNISNFHRLFWSNVEFHETIKTGHAFQIDTVCFCMCRTSNCRCLRKGDCMKKKFSI